MIVIVDTSVAVAWYIHESFSAAARKWQEAILSGTVHAVVPSLHHLEFANVMRTYVMRREMSPSLANEIYDAHLTAPLEVASAPNSILLRTALHFGSTAYDAAYIAIARETDGFFLTAEKRSTPWVEKLGKKAIVVR